MKKFVIGVLLFFFVFVSTALADVNANKIDRAVDMIKNAPNVELYEIISGKNPTQKPIQILFKDLSVFGDQYVNYECLGYKKSNTLYIYINERHKDAPIEALAALIAGRVIHVDDYDSYNEEIYAWCNEGLLWMYLTSKNKKYQTVNHPLVVRENIIKKFLIDANYSHKYIEKQIISNKSYLGYEKTSPEYNDEELKVKLQNLFNAYAIRALSD